ncbi:10589_t:CDS:2 [Funneliformis mosseae]|uniref:10589_t:CDS:1 n=1 Tax=Funneliformis mosseae TaxID=27381 RepID=A0A9N8VJV9_FUNMO|nr:10589_t:CDS:2 [Funneliformis mosseae]
MSLLLETKSNYLLIKNKSALYFPILYLDPMYQLMKYWLQSPDEIPERYQLKYFLNMTPNMKLPLSKEMFSAIPIVGLFNIDPTERDKYFEEQKIHFTAFGTLLSASHYKYLEVELYHIPTKSFIGQNRSDFVLLMRNICVVHREEKGENGKGESAKELIDKFNTWNYGDIPYLFGYYANTAAVTFCVLYNNE